ncbi:MAG: hypothetical protein K9L24_02195 [Spirochaetia bacterium]|nr:hypothetical protein [Spirochaetia bacterium]MCF7953803.1 hypothetical protein [Spirochaetales bacterium]
MKKLVFGIIIGLMIVSSAAAESQVLTPKGIQLVLYEDGRYEFIGNDGKIDVVLTDIKEKINFWDNEELFDIEFRLENHAYGTIYFLKTTVHAFDAEGNEFEPYGFGTLTTRGWDTVYIEKDSFVHRRVVFKGNPDNLTSITIQQLKPENISMRMLPENILAQELLGLHNEVPEIDLRLQIP